MYLRNDQALGRGTFRVRGEDARVFPAYAETAYRAVFFGDEVEAIQHFDPLTGEVFAELEHAGIWPATHYATDRPTIERAVGEIRDEMEARCAELEQQGKLLESHRLRQRTQFDMEMLRAWVLPQRNRELLAHTGRPRPGEPSACSTSSRTTSSASSTSRIDIAADRRHVRGRPLAEDDPGRVRLPPRARSTTGRRRSTSSSSTRRRSSSCPQRRASSSGTTRAGSSSRSCDRRAWSIRRSMCARRRTDRRPDGRVRKRVEVEERTLVTTLTKKMAEDLTDYLLEYGFQVRYLHSEIDTLERIQIIRELAGRVRHPRCGREPAARGPRPPGGLARGDPRRRQGGFPARRDLADPDDWPRRAEHPRQGDHVRGQGDRGDAHRDRGDEPQTSHPGRLQRGTRHHSGDDPEGISDISDFR